MTYASVDIGKTGRNRSLSEAAYEEIRSLILSGDLECGELRTESEISAMIGLGKAPIRAALLELRHDRLIDIVPRRGFIVRPWSPLEAANLHDARSLIEPEVAQLAARLITPEDVLRLENILTEAEAAAVRQDGKELARWDYAFHVAIAGSCGNQVLADIVVGLKNRSHHQWRITGARPEFVARIQQEHRDILDALKRADSRAAQRAMRSHIGFVHQMGGAR